MPTFLSVVISLFYSATLAVILGYQLMSNHPETGLAGIGNMFFTLFICGPIFFILIFLALFFIKRKLDPKKFLYLLLGMAILFAIVLLGFIIFR